MLLGPWGLIVLTWRFVVTSGAISNICMTYGNQYPSNLSSSRVWRVLKPDLTLIDVDWLSYEVTWPSGRYTSLRNINPEAMLWDIHDFNILSIIHWTKMNVHKPSNSPWLFFNRHHHNIIKTIAWLYVCLSWSPSPLSSMTFLERLHVATHYLQQYIFENNILSPTRLIPPVIHFDFLLSRPCFFPSAPPPWCDSSQRPGYWIKME